MSAALALLSAFAVGASDFLGSLATRKSRAELVAFLTHGASLTLMVVAVWFVAAPRVTIADLAWGASGGVSGAFGVFLFFRGMARGQISVVAPAAAVTGSLTTVLFGLLAGDQLSLLNLVGIVLAILAGGIISSVTGEDEGADLESSTSLRVLLECALAGALFGWFFVSLSYTSGDAGLWPLVSARVVSVGVLGLMAFAASASTPLDEPGYPDNVTDSRPIPLRERLWAERSILKFAAAAGALEMVASVFLLLALRRGSLSVAGVLGSLYPVSTVLLAAIILRERLTRTQWTAVGLALVAVPLTSW